MAVIAGRCEEHEAADKVGGVVFFYRRVEAVDGGVYHREGGHFGAIGAKLPDIIDRLFYLPHFEVGQFPVTRLAGEPQFFMVHLDTGHEFAETRFVGTVKLLLQAGYLCLQCFGIRCMLAAGDRQNQNQAQRQR